MKNITKTVAIALIVFTGSAGAAFADGNGLSNFELSKLRISQRADRNRDGRLTAQEVLLARPGAFDLNGDGTLSASERGIALQQLRRRRLN